MAREETRIKEADSSDLPFLRQMLVEAVNWDLAKELVSVDELLGRPELRKILTRWGRRGDVALVMVDDNGVRLGACWYRCWTEHDHSYGFVSEEAPELGIGVVPEYRGRGLGSRLIKELIAVAAAQGRRRLSLSVASENPAIRLYEKLGFRRYRKNGDSWTMIAETGSEA